ncbi:putative phosphothreonine lyase domain-containing protein [Robbsia andropogonis]|uniref:putative phosphothreonine lyase domain-containing protein n=1 Tax=Robbsia andropogonis TaxID=28092 RepID=UPI001C9264B3|nr:putative phosphothreonine lyase domain-containg protein [Robbsia andropogonis]
MATALHAMPYDTHLICVYTSDWNDWDDVMRACDVLRKIGFTEELGYKRDEDTRAGKYGGADEWYLRE